ncbi:L,D-transpeptidase [Methylobacterium planeticum]|uniref:L,D-transpeptidase n=1 Tax=Methylobacterium planeticum TaxID=2615211 RepID=A0A6N6MBE9_9HYPH|nr:L,D-transpeptidase [Methylobacterium planeticum]KAB1067893.1 L,D-transpeptidase [Methylobacterium planeticum]
MRVHPDVALLSLLISTALSSFASADVRVRIDQTSQRMSVAVDGQPLYDWRVSTGLPGHSTPNGTFRVLRMERVYFSRKYDNAPMPHAIFFTAAGHAIHGTNHIGRLGHPASHGCVRLSPSNAAALFSIVKAEGSANTRIWIGGSEPLIASGKARGFQATSRRQRYEDDGTTSVGWSMGVEPPRRYYDPAPSYRSYRQPYEPYGYGSVEGDFE